MKITDKLKMAVMGVSAVTTLGAAALVAPSVYAEPVTTGSKPADRYVNDTTQQAATGDSRGRYVNPESQQAATGDNRDLMTVLQVIINVVLGVIAFVAVVMIIMGGIQYTTSSGDTAKVTKAKNTILYGVIGLVIALLAFAIVNFVISNVFK